VEVIVNAGRSFPAGRAVAFRARPWAPVRRAAPP